MTSHRFALQVLFIFSLLFASPAFSQEALPALIKKVEPSIVVILTYSRDGKFLGQGSGFFINQEGDVVTNDHVLQEANQAVVRTGSGKEYPVKKVLAEDTEGDLIRVSVAIPEEAVRPLTITSELPEVGERIIVIGTPFGLDQTVSDGIVSAIRVLPKFGNIIQVTAPISPGSSGSPVINMKGEVIGIATFFIVAGQNLNFAIPGERVTRLTVGQGETLAERQEGKIKDWLASAEGLYITGLRFLWAEDYGRALSYFMEAIKRNPDHALSYFQIGYCLSRFGRYPEAIDSYQRASRIQPEDGEIYNNLCFAYGKVRRFDKALESCGKAIQLKPDMVEAHNNLGWTYQMLGRYQEAIESCKKAIRIKPDFAMAHYNLGKNYASLKKYEEAIASYKEAIRIQFNYAEGHLNLGAAYFQIGRVEEAIISYKQAIRLKPSLPEAHLNLGMSYLKLGDRGAAIEEYKILRELDKELANQLFNLIYE